MTDRDRAGDPQHPREQDESDDSREDTRGKDVMHGRSFAGANIANTERDQTSERQRIAEHGASLDEVGEVTDAEIEAREERRAERAED
ncbi:MAG TPA: hypothetical protein VGH98_07200 [Gemmatimonadaceae bacterium]|jgi:hypothetical protein